MSRDLPRVTMPLELEVAGGATMRVENLGPEGAFLASPPGTYPQGSLFHFRMELPDATHSVITGQARVVRTDPFAGCGLKFVDLDPEMKTKLERFIIECMEQPPEGMR